MMREVNWDGLLTDSEREWPFWPVLVALAIFLVWTAQYNYLLFHTLAELFAITVGVIMSVVAWNTYRFSKNHFLMFLGCGYFWISILDLIHTLAYKGMNLIDGAGANMAVQYWLVARFSEALLLLVSPLFLTRAMNRRLVNALFAFIALGFIFLIVSGRFPDGYIENVGLTPFKVASEYVIILILGAAILFLYRSHTLLEPKILRMMAVAIALTMVAELAFTFYVDVYGLSNMVGHLAKFLSFGAVYLAIIRTTLVEPFRTLARGASSFDAIPDPIVLVDGRGIIRHSNQAAQLFGNPPGETLPGQHCHTVFHDPAISSEACPVCQAMAAHRPIHMELAVQQRWWMVHLTPIAPRKSFGGMIHVASDITERKQVEKALHQLKDALEIQVEDRTRELSRSNRELELFAYMASHDLQEPLRIIGSYTQLLQKRYQDRLDEKADKYILYIVDSVRYMQNLIESLLAYSRIQTQGKTPEPVDSGIMLRKALDILSSRIREEKARIEHVPLPMVLADDIQLVQVFQNLIGNAIKFHGPDAPVIHIGVHRDGGMWVFSVTDNGIGIESRHQQKIFAIFQRLNSRTDYEGTGIGLSLCQRIVERHHGRIWVQSQPGSGSTFFFSFPATDEQVGKRPETTDERKEERALHI